MAGEHLPPGYTEGPGPSNGPPTRIHELRARPVHKCSFEETASNLVLISRVQSCYFKVDTQGNNAQRPLLYNDSFLLDALLSVHHPREATLSTVTNAWVVGPRNCPLPLATEAPVPVSIRKSSQIAPSVPSLGFHSKREASENLASAPELEFSTFP